jgi:hypothetical protein
MNIPAASCRITPNFSRLFKRRKPQCPHDEFDEKKCCMRMDARGLIVHFHSNVLPQ